MLLGKHGLIALFCARFIPVVRSLLPLMMGLRVHRVSKFHYFAWLSAILWTLLLCGLGLLLPLLPHQIQCLNDMRWKLLLILDLLLCI